MNLPISVVGIYQQFLYGIVPHQAVQQLDSYPNRDHHPFPIRTESIHEFDRDAS